MKRSRFTEEQIIGILKEHQAGLGAKELCRKHGVSNATSYKWRAKFGRIEVSEAKLLIFNQNWAGSILGANQHPRVPLDAQSNRLA
jgi:predicted site-specific integrase-resolvase